MIRSLAFALLLLATTAASAEDAKPAAPRMQPAAVGDYWAYAVRDEVTGADKGTRTLTVTDISKTEIAVRSVQPGGQIGSLVYDQSWNAIRDVAWTYSPNDGLGFNQPLAVNASWKIAADAINAKTAIGWKHTGTTKVLAEEEVTTKAGTFRTFVVESKHTAMNPRDPLKKAEVTIRSWFSPDVNRWVRRNTVTRLNGLVATNETIELTAFGRR